MAQDVSVARSLAKSLTYRLVIMTLDFSALWVMTRTLKVAITFMVVSNLYTTGAYFLHERIWSRIPWGLTTASSAGV